VTPRLSIVVTTLGERPHEFTRLLDSIAVEQMDGLQLIVVDQSADGDAHRIARAHAVAGSTPLACVTSAKGVSRGRNAGLAMATAPLVTFPDDDAWYPRNGIVALVDRMERDRALDALMTVVRGYDGLISTNDFERSACPVHRDRIFHQVTEAAMVCRTDAIRAVGGFDEQVGPGSGTPWGAAEGADLMLRLLAIGINARFDPSLFIHHEDTDLTDEAGLSRVRSYSRGVGYVVVKNHVLWRYLYVLGVRPALGVVVAAIRGQRDLRRVRTARLGGHIRGISDGLRSSTLRGSRHG